VRLCEWLRDFIERWDTACAVERDVQSKRDRRPQ
jgi:hypothetical protein